MNTVPGKNAQEWAAFTNRFGRLLTITPEICFWLVVGGSVYGIHQSIQSQYPNASLLIALAVAFCVQLLNGVSVHFSTRWIASWFLGGELRDNKNQHVGRVDAFVGLFCIAFTACICGFDFEANKRGAEEAAKRITEKPVERVVDTKPHDDAIRIAEGAVAAAKAAENAERSAFEAEVDKQINKRKNQLAKRQGQLAKVEGQWAANERNAIVRELSNLESQRRQRKAEFVPKKSDVAGASSKLSEVSSQNSRLLTDKQIQADSTNTRNESSYENKKENAGLAIFVIYIVAMVLWHFCHGLLNFRALKYDEQHPESGNALIAIAETLKDGFENKLWSIRAWLAEKMPEDEIRGYVKEELLAALNSDICRETFETLINNPGIKEAGIYMVLAHHDPLEVRQALRWLKTGKLAFENSGTWTGDTAQAEKIPGFFLSSPHPPPV